MAARVRAVVVCRSSSFPDVSVPACSLGRGHRWPDLVVLFAGVNVTVFLILGGLATRTDIADDPDFVLTSAGCVRLLGQP